MKASVFKPTLSTIFWNSDHRALDKIQNIVMCNPSFIYIKNLRYKLISSIKYCINYKKRVRSKVKGQAH